MKTSLLGAVILATAAVGCTEPEKPKDGAGTAASTTSANKPAPDKSAAPEAPKVIAAISSSVPCDCINGINSRATKGNVTKVVARMIPGVAKMTR